MHRMIARTGGAATLALLTACSSGGDDTTVAPYVPDSALFRATSPNATLSVVGLNRSSGNTFLQTTALTAPNTLTGGNLDGTVSYTYTQGANNSIALTSGGTAVLEDQGTQYAFRFGSADMVGVAGIATTNMPSSGAATYAGFADVSVNDGSGSPKTLTTVSAAANFGTSSITVNLGNGGNDWLRIQNAAISGNTFSGGSLTVSTSFATDPGNSTGLKHEGKFFNAGASEMGGVFILDKTGSGTTFKAQGVYAGNDGS